VSPADDRPAWAHRVADRRGLTTAGAAVLMIVTAVAGGTFDVLTGQGLRLVFAVCFVLGCALAALLTHREHLRAVIVMPPLVYVVLALGASVAEGVGGSGSFLRTQVLELANAVVLGAPVLWVAFLAVLVLALLRGAGRRRAR
jgi:hypothetical protein